MQYISVLGVVVLAFSCTLALDFTLDQRWKSWKETHNKQYSDAEENIRYEILFHISTFYLLLKYQFLVVLYGKTISRKLKNIIVKLILVYTHTGSE